VESLQETSKEKTQKTGFIEGLWNNKKGTIDSMEEQIRILKDDLDLKIEENEMTHMQVTLISQLNINKS